MISTLLSPSPLSKLAFGAQGLVARVEDAFVQWQAQRLQEIPEEKLWAQAMVDTRSFAEIRQLAK